MTDEAMSPLRRRMIEDMTIRKLAPKTQQGYVRTIKSFAVFLGRSPDTASFEDVRRFQLYLAANGADTGPACRRGRLAHGLRRRQQADGHPRGARQRRQGPQRDALCEPARTAARLVAGGATTRLALSGPR
jgi:hypothetical protein